jgi:hypothetical protein
MEAKIKAQELVFQFYELVKNIYPSTNGIPLAKKCALIAVDEIILAIDFDWMEIQNLEAEHRYWDKVKQEIEKL